jgi:hypothetical protein
MGMMTSREPNREVIETGTEPEFFIHDIDRWEDAGDGMIRVLVVSRRGNSERGEYWLMCSPDRLAYMCRKGLTFAEEARTARRRPDGH